MQDVETYIKSLLWRLENLKKEIASDQAKIRELFAGVEDKQSQAQNLAQLLAAEGHVLDDPELAGLTAVDLAQAAYDFLASSSKNEPIHYTDLANELMSKGILISGKNPAANLLSHINRDERFVRIGPGMYGLESWGLTPMLAKQSRRKRRKKKA